MGAKIHVRNTWRNLVDRLSYPFPRYLIIGFEGLGGLWSGLFKVQISN